MQRSDILEAGGHEERDPFFLQVGLASQQAPGKSINLPVEVGVSQGLLAVNQCDIARMGLCSAACAWFLHPGRPGTPSTVRSGPSSGPILCPARCRFAVAITDVAGGWDGGPGMVCPGRNPRAGPGTCNRPCQRPVADGPAMGLPGTTSGGCSPWRRNAGRHPVSAPL